MRVLLTSCHSESYEGVFQSTVANQVAYCRKHGYSFTPHYMTTKEITDGNHNSYLEFIKEMLPYYDVIMTVGADVLFMNTDKTVEQMFAPEAGQQIATAPDQPTVYSNEIILWRNCRSSIDLLEHLIATRFQWIKHPWGWQQKLIDMINTGHCLAAGMKVVDQHHQNTQWEFYEDGDWIVHFYFRYPPKNGTPSLWRKSVWLRSLSGG